MVEQRNVSRKLVIGTILDNLRYKTIEMNDRNDSTDSWLKFLNPETLRSNLILASCYIAAYETLKDSIIDQIRSFFTHGFDQNGPIVSESYDKKVLSLDSKRNPFRASILWLVNNGVIDASDHEKIETLTIHRNELAHDLPRFLSSADREVQVQLFESINALVRKIDCWWIINVELEINSDFDGREIKQEEIISGRMLFLNLLLGIATGAHSTDLYQELLKSQQQKSNR